MKGRYLVEVHKGGSNVSKQHGREHTVSCSQLAKEDEMKEKTEASKTLSRKQFVKGAAVGAVGAAAVGGLASCAPAATPVPTAAPEPTATTAPAAAPTPEPEQWDYDVDVVVAGSGNGGTSAFLSAADAGADSLLIEVSGVTGGSSLFSGGYLHTAGVRTWADYNAYTRGLHDPVLGKVFVETFWNEYIPWLESKGAYMSRNPDTPDRAYYARDYSFGKGEPASRAHRLYFDSLIEAAEGLGGTVMVKTRAVKLHTDDEGRVTGLQAMVWANSPLEENQTLINIKAKKVILATGNFYGNKELLTRYISSDAYRALNWGGPYQSGEGIAMAQVVGAKMSRYLSTWSGGVNVITPVTQWGDDPEGYEQWLSVTEPENYGQQYGKGRLSSPFSISGPGATVILVNLDGKRFMDESNPDSTQRRQMFFVLRQPQGEAWVIADQEAYDASDASESRINSIIEAGGNVITADTIEEFADRLEAVGMYKASLLKTIAEYNQAIDNGTTGELDPQRSEQETYWKIAKPPFYAVPVTASFYYTAGGLAINEDAQTLDFQLRPIPNLYSPPPLGGGIMNQVYTGGIAIAGTFGYRAGKHAAANL
jgi:succinate dehydrogenase/fumarate reductase flavoprotein subunit